jgi:hypothetical protein
MQQAKESFLDFAVISRRFDKPTGHWILALSGLEAHNPLSWSGNLSVPRNYFEELFWA